MRRLVITQNVTLDGSIEMLDDWFDPQSQDEELLAETHRQDAESDALLLGRQTFEDFRGYWPHQHDDQTGISAYLDDDDGSGVEELDGDRGRPGAAGTRVEGEPGERHRAHRQHSPRAHPDRRGRGG